MKLTTRIFTQRLLCLFICFISATIVFGQNNDFQHLNDSLLKVIASTQGEEKLKAYYALTKSERFFRLSEKEIDLVSQYINDFINEAHKQKNKEYECIAYDTKLGNLWNFMNYDEFIRKANEYLPFFKNNGFQESYYNCYSFLLIAYSLKGNSKRHVEEVKKMYAEAKQENCLYGIAKAAYLIAQIYFNEKRYGEAEKYFQETIKNAIPLLKEKPDQTMNYDLVFYGYDALAQSLFIQKKFNQLSSLISDWKKHIIAYEKTFGCPYPDLFGYYKNCVSIYIEEEKYDKVEIYCDSMELTASAPNEDFIWAIKATICEKSKEYNSAIDWINKCIERNTDLGELDYLVHLLKRKADILNIMGHDKESYSVLNSAFQLNDSIRLLKNNAQLDEIRTQYEVDKHIAEKERNFNYFLFAIGGCILLVVALGIWMFYSRKITRKNRILAQQIKELTLQQEKQINEILEKTSFEETDPYLCVESRLDKLCIAIRDLLLKEKIYRDSSITQEIMVRQLGTNKNLFTQAILHCFGMKFNDYVNFLRLKDAVQLLEQSDLSIIEISDKVGFGVVSTFRRQFSAKYDMTPTDYRNLTKKTDGCHPERSEGSPATLTC